MWGYFFSHQEENTQFQSDLLRAARVYAYVCPTETGLGNIVKNWSLGSVRPRAFLRAAGVENTADVP